MQRRLSQGAHIALGLQSGQLSAENVRAAFLQLTKQFHPARFGRLSTETQRLSNEVFLGIKSAHELLVRQAGGTVRGARPPHQSGAMRQLVPDETTRPIPIQPRAVSTQQPAASRTMTPTMTPTMPPTMPPTSPPGSPPGGRRATSTSQLPPIAPNPAPPRAPAFLRPVTEPPTRGSAPHLAPPPPASFDPATQRGVGPWSAEVKPAPAPASPPDERAELQQVMNALTAKHWVQARTLLTGLAARVPSSKQYRALLAYTRGREAQAVGRGEEAVTEFQRALQFDPDLQQAKSALAELLRRR